MLECHKNSLAFHEKQEKIIAKLSLERLKRLRVVLICFEQLKEFLKFRMK